MIFTLAVGIERLGAYSLKLQERLTELLGEYKIQPIGHPGKRGAFLAIANTSADAIAAQLRELKIIVDAREGLIRICPDILTTDAELAKSIEKLGLVMHVD